MQAKTHNMRDLKTQFPIAEFYPPIIEKMTHSYDLGYTVFRNPVKNALSGINTIGATSPTAPFSCIYFIAIDNAPKKFVDAENRHIHHGHRNKYAAPFIFHLLHTSTG